MKNLIIIGILILLLSACALEEEVKPVMEKPSALPNVQLTPTASPPISGQLAKDQVDIVPEIDISQCLTQIKTTNPSMTQQQANDNCYTLEAVNKNDPIICDQVSTNFKEICLSQLQ